jgi:type II secretory pathway component PulM
MSLLRPERGLAGTTWWQAVCDELADDLEEAAPRVLLVVLAVVAVLVLVVVALLLWAT